MMSPSTVNRRKLNTHTHTHTHTNTHTPGCRPPELGRVTGLGRPLLNEYPPGIGQTPKGWADPLDADSPPVGQTPSGLDRSPWMQTRQGLSRPPLDADPRVGHPPPRVQNPPISQHPTGYASYWNAYLLYFIFEHLAKSDFFALRVFIY